MERKYKNLLKDTFVFSLGKFGSRMVLFFLVPLYTNYLSQEQYGTADLVFTVSQLVMPLFSIVIFDAVVRFGLMKGVKKEDVLLDSFAVLLFCAIVTVIFTPLFSLYKGIAEWRYYLSALIILAATMDVEMNYLKVKGKNLSYSIISIVQSTILAISNIVLLICLSLGIKGYLLSTIISYACCVILAFFAGHVFEDIKKASFDKPLLKQMLQYSSPLILNNISWWVIQSSDKLMLEAMISAAALGLYTAASKIPSLINVVITVFQQAWGISSIKEIESTNDTSFYAGVFKIYSTGVFLCCLILNCIVKPFMHFYVGNDFFEAWKYAPLLVASAGFSAISAYYGSLYGALKKSANNMATTLIAAITNVIVNYTFIRLCGGWGAIIGTIVSYILIAYLRMLDIRRFLKFYANVPLFVINSMIIVAHAIIASVDFYPYYVSAIALSAYMVINCNTIKEIVKAINKKIKRHH